MRLKELRANKTQQEIATALNIKQTLYSKYEREDIQPNIEMLCKIADHFGVSLDYLCEHKNPNTQELGYLEPQAIDLINIYKELNEENKIRAHAYACGLLAGQE